MRSNAHCEENQTDGCINHWNVDLAMLRDYVKGPQKSLQFILWAPRVSAPSLMAIHQTVVEKFLSEVVDWVTDIAIPRAYYNYTAKLHCCMYHQGKSYFDIHFRWYFLGHSSMFAFLKTSLDHWDSSHSTCCCGGLYWEQHCALLMAWLWASYWI